MRNLRWKTCVIPCSLAWMFGCAGIREVEPKIRTITMVGDKTSPVVAGTPGDSVVARSETPERKLDEGGRVSGRVVDEDGLGVADAEVRLAVNGRARGKSVRVTTDEAGGFTLHGLLPGESYRIVAEHQDGDGLQTGSAVVEAPERLVRIRLRTTDTDSPATEEDRRINRVSNRADLSEDSAETPQSSKASNRGEPGSFEPSPRGINPADILPEGETASAGHLDEDQTQAESPARTPRSSKIARVSKAPWQRGPVDRTNPNADASPVESKTSDEDIDPPTSTDQVDSKVPTSTAKTTQTPGAADPDDIPDPLPPAREPSTDQSAPNSQPAPMPKTESPTATNAPSSNEPNLPDPAPRDDKPSNFPHLTDPAPSNDLPNADTGPTAEASDLNKTPEPDRAGPNWSSRETREISASGREMEAEPVETIPQIAVDDSPKLPKKHVKWGDLPRPDAGRTNRAEATDALNAPKTAQAAQAPQASGSRLGRLFRRIRGEGDDGATQATCRFDEQRHRVVDFSLPDLSGRPVHFADLNRDAEYVLLDFWNVAADPSADHFKQISELRERYGPGKIHLAAIAYDSGAAAQRSAAVISSARRLGPNSALLFGGVDGPCPLQTALHVQEFPTLVLLDKRGQVLWRSSGGDDQTLTRLDRVLAANIEAKQGTFRR